ncbi:unnamed protein product [Rotaria sp. Silwood2]|nr:unnamed protein product [Rotaria sp. Silwood2]
MEPDTYGGVVNSATLPPTLIHSTESIVPPIASSSNTINYETRSSSRRHHHHHHNKKQQNNNNVTSNDSQDERIEVKILPQDDNWGETTTITCNGGNEDTLTNNNDTSLQLNIPNQHLTKKIHHRKRSIMICHFIIYLICLIAFISPILFLTLPYLLIQSDLIIINDYTLLLTIIFKLLLLFLVVIILEIKYLYPKWIVKVVRSPDGQIKQYTIGSMSIQEASIYLLEQYYKDFPVFNPWLENIHQTQARQHGTLSTKSIGSQSNASTIATGVNGNRDLGRSMHGYNDRFYDELDYERRVRKRRTKLLSSCEDAFTHVRKCLHEKYGSHIPMDAREAAQAVFSSMSRSLQKYLRITRQQPYFTRESIISHLSTCLSHNLSPRAFLERYIQTESQPLATLLFPALLSTTKRTIEQSWTIICDTQSYINDKNQRKTISINQSIYSNLIFILKQQHAEHIALICTFHRMPRINLLENFFDLKQNKFVLKLNSETSV